MKKLIFTIWILVLAVTININRAEGQWVKIGPYGGDVRAADSYGNKLFIGAEGCGGYISLDNGDNWNYVLTIEDGHFNLFPVTSIEMTETTIFVGAYDSKIFRSTDDGETWVISNSGIPYHPAPLTSIVSLNGVLYTGPPLGIYRSTNNGNSWVDVNNSLTSVSNVSDFVTHGSNIFASFVAGFHYGILRGNSVGENWTIALDSVYIRNILSDGTNLFASGGDSGVLRSSDNGYTWEYVNNGLTNLNVHSMKLFESNLYVTTYEGVFMSTNKGNNWTPINNGLPSLLTNHLFTGDGKLFVSYDYSRGIYQTSNNGINWNESNSGFSALTINSFASNDQYLFASGEYSSVFRTSNHGINWTLINNGLEKSSRFIYTKDSFVFCGTYDELFRSSNNGENWESIMNIPSPSVYRCISSLNSNIFVGTSRNLYASSDNGDNWVAKNNGLPVQKDVNTIYSKDNYLYAGIASGSGIYNIYISSDYGENWIFKNNGFTGSVNSFSKNGNYIFAAGLNGIFRSSDNGENWIPHNSGFIQGYNSAYSIISSEEYIFATSDSGFFYSNDFGLNWYQDNDGFNENKMILQLHSYQNQVFAGFSSGSVWKRNISVLPVELASFSKLVIENNVTLNWQTTSESNNSGFDIERSNVKDQWAKAGFVQGNGNSIEPKEYSFTDKNLAPGKYKYRLKQIDFNGNYKYFNLTGEVNIGVPDKYDLSQNYPNPFNPSTVIRYSLSENGFTSLKIYDITGKEIAKLINEKQEAGRYEVIFNGSNFASGVYFYELRSGSFVSQKRMLLLK